MADQIGVHASTFPGRGRGAPGATKVYLVGGGIASLAAAAFMIRDGDIPGQDITIFEELGVLGGSLDGSGSAEKGYMVRGGRMFESKYLCTLGLYSSIPTLDGSRMVTDEILEFNKKVVPSSKARLVRGGKRQDSPRLGLSERHILTIERLVIESEFLLGRSTIAEQFDPSFFETDFWVMWATEFSFQTWHSAVELKRYFVRFIHLISGFNRLEGILRTPYNQYDSLIRPLQHWLDTRGVTFQPNTRVTDLGIGAAGDDKVVTHIAFERDGKHGEIEVAASDHVLVTLGSMTESSSLGGMDTPPVLKGKKDGGAWTLWETIAAGRPEFGNPSVFADQIDKSKWVSFTTTTSDPTLLNFVFHLTGNVPGEGGEITFPESNWLATIVIPHHPHFIGQPDNVNVVWGYGLFPDKPGNFVDKPMSACTGREIMTEVLGHLHVDAADSRTILQAANCICIPCMMPFITSQFLPRGAGDRPQVVPPSYRNLAFIGQYCELPEDTVFTVEYSVRSAQVAAYALLGLDRAPPDVYKGMFDPRVLLKAFIGLHDLGS